jgi:hypothetical protein
MCAKFDTGDFYEKLPRKFGFLKNMAKIYGKYVKTKVGFIFASYIKSPHRRCLRLKRYQAVRVPEGGIKIARTRHNVTLYVHYLSLHQVAVAMACDGEQN